MTHLTSPFEQHMLTALRGQLGERLYAQLDAAGVLRIGVGRRVDSFGGITPEESSYLLRNDLARAEAETTRVLPWTLDLDDARRGVIVLLTFHLGIHALLQYSRMLWHIQTGDYDWAAAELEQSTWGQQHEALAILLAHQLREGVWS